MKKRFTEEQIIGFLREVEAGLPVNELCRARTHRAFDLGQRGKRFLIVDILQRQPRGGIAAEVARQARGGIRGGAAAFVDDLVDARGRTIFPQGFQTVTRKAAQKSLGHR